MAYTATTTDATNKVTAATDDPSAVIVVKLGETVIANKSSPTWAVGANVITVIVTDGISETTYTVTVTKLSNEKAITEFTVVGQTGDSTINATTKTVDITVPTLTDVSGLVATFVLSTGASAKIGEVPQVSGTTANDFTAAVTYTVVAEDESTQDWTVTITKAD